MKTTRGGGAFGYSAGLKGGYKNEDKSSENENTSADNNRMTITYNVSFRVMYR